MPELRSRWPYILAARSSRIEKVGVGRGVIITNSKYYRAIFYKHYNLTMCVYKIRNGIVSIHLIQDAS